MDERDALTAALAEARALHTTLNETVENAVKLLVARGQGLEQGVGPRAASAQGLGLGLGP